MRLSACYWLACLLYLAAPGAATAQIYLPLGPGCYWQYTGDVGDAFARTVTATIEMAGEAVSVLSHSGYGPDEGLDQYYTANANGDVLFWGFYREFDDWGLLYVPPLPLVQGPLATGQRWSVVAEIFSIPDNLPAGDLVAERVVLSEGLETVPAGEYYAYAIGWELPGGLVRALASRSCDPTGRHLTPGRDFPAAEYWSAGLGIVREETTQIWRLTDFDGPTVIAAGSWGGIKALY